MAVANAMKASLSLDWIRKYPMAAMVMISLLRVA
jgi:hypothetical protein